MRAGKSRIFRPDIRPCDERNFVGMFPGFMIYLDEINNQITNLQNSIGSDTWIGLSDTPETYVAGRYPVVNNAGNAIEFEDFNDLQFTFGDSDGSLQQEEFLVWNPTQNSIELGDKSSTGPNIGTNQWGYNVYRASRNGRAFITYNGWRSEVVDRIPVSMLRVWKDSEPTINGAVRRFQTASGTEIAPSYVRSGEVIGKTSFDAWAGPAFDNFIEYASITAIAPSAHTATNRETDLEFITKPADGTTGTTGARFIMKGSGRLHMLAYNGFDFLDNSSTFVLGHSGDGIIDSIAVSSLSGTDTNGMFDASNEGGNWGVNNYNIIANTTMSGGSNQFNTDYSDSGFTSDTQQDAFGFDFNTDSGTGPEGNISMTAFSTSISNTGNTVGDVSTSWSNGTISHTGNMVYGSSASIIFAAASVNSTDLTPADFLAKDHVYLTPNSGGTEITGLPASQEGARITLINTSSVDQITLPLNNTGSPAGQRFVITPLSATIAIQPGAAVEVMYTTNIGSGGWVIISLGT